jgi:OmpA-OmpF porin, OOP family
MMVADDWCATGICPGARALTGIGVIDVRCPRVRDRVGEGGGRIRFFVGDHVCDHAHGPMRGQRVCAGLLAYPELDDALGVIEAIQFGRGDYFAHRPQFPVDPGMPNRRSSMNKQAKIKAQMASFDKLIQDLDTRYHLGPEAGLLAQETLGLITGRPGGIGSFVNRFKAAGFAVEVASWLGGPDPVPLSGQEVEQTLGSDVISGIANKIGVSQIFARTILGYAIPEVIVLLAQGGAIPLAIRAWAASFRDSAIHSSTPVNEITQHRAEQIRPSRTEHSGAAAGLRPLLIPGASLLITLGLLLGYFIGAGDRGAIHSAPIVAQNAPVASPHVPSIPARLALHNENGLIAYSGTVGDDATRSSITDSLKTVFGAQKITGDLSVDLNAGPAHWAKGFKAALDNFKIPGLQALFEGNAASVGGAIPEADRGRIMTSLKSVLGPQFAFATIAGSSANETPTASSALTSGFSVENPIGAPNQPILNLPTIYFAPLVDEKRKAGS